MGITLDATLMGEQSNSYCSLSFADDYFSNHFNALKQSKWAAFSDEQKSQTLVQACYDLEQFRFTIEADPSLAKLRWDNVANRFTAYQTVAKFPVKYSIYQQLQFPRNKDFKSNGTIFIPERIMMAQCEQAIYLANLDETALSNRLQGLNLDKISIGKGAIELTQEYDRQGSSLAPLAYEWMSYYLIRMGRMNRA